MTTDVWVQAETSSMTVILRRFWAPLLIRAVLGNLGISRGPVCFTISGLWTVEKCSDLGTAAEVVTNMAAESAADIP